MALSSKGHSAVTNKITKFTNCLLLRDHAIIKEDLWVRKGKIIDPTNLFYDERRTSDEIIDCGGALIAPGFIDLQINGGFGVDFTHDVETIDRGISIVAEKILQHGVTSFLPTIVSSAPETYQKLLPKIRKRLGGLDGASVLGIHLEGPFINKERKGAHEAEMIIENFEKGLETVKKVYGTLENVIMITLAPELPNALDVIQKLCQEKIIVSLGHSSVDFDTAQQAQRKGATFITHLFNAMVPFHHRDPGLIGLIANKYPSMFSVITDGTHTHPATIRIAHRANPEGFVIVTDAISAYGLSEGTHYLGNKKVDIRDKKAFLSGTETMCGSIISFIDSVKIYKESAGCSIVDALEAGSFRPAKVLKLNRVKGTLNYNADADFIFLNDKLDIIQTWIAGNRVYKNEAIQDNVFSYNPNVFHGSTGTLDIQAKRSKVYFSVMK